MDKTYQIRMFNEIKKCGRCKEKKDTKSFYLVNKGSKKVPDYMCKECRIKYTQEWVKKQESDYRKLSDLKTRYGINKKDYVDLLKNQNNRCAICNTNLIQSRTCLDHDHKRNLLRGLLCINCNVGLGVFKDSIKNLQKAIGYLKEGGSLNVQIKDKKDNKVRCTAY